MTSNQVTHDDLQSLQNSLQQSFSESLKVIDSSLKNMYGGHNEQLEYITAHIDALDHEPNPQPSFSSFHNRMPTFSGDGDDPAIFLQQFRNFVTLSKWSDEQALLVFPLCLTRNAEIWFYGLAPNSYSSLQELVALFTSRFISSSDNFRLRQELKQRKQLPGETVAVFAADIRRRCHRLALSEDDMLHYFLDGLRSDIQSFVILKEPKTFVEAEGYARMKSSVPSVPTFSMDDILKLQGNFVQQLRAAQPSPSSQLAAISDRSPHQESDSQLELRRIIQEELRSFSNANFSNRNNNFQQRQGRPRFPRNNQSRDNNRPNNRGDFGRDSRTTNGAIICYNCNRVGHYASQCRRARDPRIPPDRSSSPSRDNHTQLNQSRPDSPRPTQLN